MWQRGPISIENLSSPVITARRPDPPDHLDEADAEEWRAIVGRMPADWFPRETRPILTELCQLTVIARMFNEDVKAHRERCRASARIDKEMLRLLSMRSKLAYLIASLSHKLRLTNIKRFHVDTAGRRARMAPNEATRPWDERHGHDS
jgi:phage terminase small subunit